MPVQISRSDKVVFQSGVIMTQHVRGSATVLPLRVAGSGSSRAGIGLLLAICWLFPKVVSISGVAGLVEGYRYRGRDVIHMNITTTVLCHLEIL